MAKKFKYKCYVREDLCNSHAHYEELVQIGTITLWNCIYKFDRTREVQFSTYVCRALHNAMHRYANPKKRPITTSRFSIVHENRLHTKHNIPEERLDMFQNNIKFLNSKGYKLKASVQNFVLI